MHRVAGFLAATCRCSGCCAIALFLGGMILCAGTVAATGEQVQEKPGDSVIDLEYGEEINETCAACHGEFGEGSLDGEYPRLAGMPVAYLARQLRLFKQRERLNIPMMPYATERELPEEDVMAVSAYLASIELPTKLPPIDESADFNAYQRLQASKRVINIARYPGNIEAGGGFYRRECASCHGNDGYGDAEDAIPQLAGQHSLYLLKQVNSIRNSERLHDEPDDAEVFQEYSDVEIGDLLAYLSVQDDD